MKCNLHNVIDDVQQLSNRIRDRELLADDLCQKIHSVQAQLISMRQYQEEILSFHELARKLGNRPKAPLILCLAAEDKQVQQLKIENHALFNSLEEHQTVLDLIMTKYREQVSQLLHTNQVESMVHSEAQSPVLLSRPIATRAEPASGIPANEHSAPSSAGSSKQKVINLASQVATLATFARDVSDKGDAYANDLELELHRLRSENAGLRELLEISGTFRVPTTSNVRSALLTTTATTTSCDNSNVSGGAKLLSLHNSSSGIVFDSNENCDVETGLPTPPASASQHRFLSSLDIKKHCDNEVSEDYVYSLLRSFDQMEGEISNPQEDEDEDDKDTSTVTEDIEEDDDMLDAEPYIRSFPSLG